MSSAGFVAFVLHAHLPYVRHPEHAQSLEERWLFEATWECFVPLLGMLDRLAGDHVRGALTLSISPPLAAMLRDPFLQRRFDVYLAQRIDLARRAERYYRARDAHLESAAAFYAERLAFAEREIQGVYQEHGDLLSAFTAHARAHTLDLITTTATHAYLPGLSAVNMASARAQLRLGFRLFEALSGHQPKGLWLPECAFEPRLDREMYGAGARYTVLDAHGLLLASKRPPQGVFGPVLSPSGVAYFGRDPNSARDVWSRQHGYPGHPAYRDFYRDIGFDLPESELEGEILPDGTRVFSGIKLHRVGDKSSPSSAKTPYDPQSARAQALLHAEHFVGRCIDELRAHAQTQLNTAAPALIVAPFDAELFGHFWFEGPVFLEHALRLLAAPSSKYPSNQGDRVHAIEAVTLSDYLRAWPSAPICEPAASSWGEGGFGAAWTGEAAAALLRPMHRSALFVQRTCERLRGRADLPQIQARALDQAIREQLLSESSDWAFMRTRGDMRAYADARFEQHLNHVQRLLRLAMSEHPAPSESDWLFQLRRRNPFAAELCGQSLWDAFDPFPP